ncbi:MAG: SAM-dependent chlorinase/fluorinase [Alphaproteobacteria bacterium]|nr:SAM-dependent chlorinase/fluorinase [Alphaproteobacteria bacterium]
MIVLFTDFGLTGPYVGQMKAVLSREAPGLPIIDLFADAPVFDARRSAYLLAAYAREFPPPTVFLAIVDPGVGSERRAIVVEADGRRYVGPDNGLFELAWRRASRRRAFAITWQPKRLSASFHGRDLFAPVAARLAAGSLVPMAAIEDLASKPRSWPDDLAEIVYVDHYGNAMTGLRASRVDAEAIIEAAGRRLARQRTFSDAAPGEAFWYENANGLVEISVNRGRADRDLGLSVGSPLAVSLGTR